MPPAKAKRSVNRRKSSAAQCSLKSVTRYDGDGKEQSYVCTTVTREHLIARSKRYLDIIAQKELPKGEREELIKATLHNFANFFNKGYIEYRKAVAVAGDFAALEWSGKNTRIRDVLGRE